MSEALEMTEEATDGEVEITKEAVASEKQDPLLEDFQSWVDADMEDDDIIMKLHQDHGLALPSAVTRFRKLKSQAGLTSPRGHKSGDVMEFIKDCIDQDMARPDIYDAMVEKFGYTRKSAQSTFSTLGKKLGITGEGGGMSARVPLADVVTFMRANSEMKKQEFIAKMADEVGYAESTCGAFYTYMPMAQEWARQEIEAKS